MISHRTKSLSAFARVLLIAYNFTLFLSMYALVGLVIITNSYATNDSETEQVVTSEVETMLTERPKNRAIVTHKKAYIQGTILNESGEPLVGLQVVFPELMDAIVTDEYGSFFLSTSNAAALTAFQLVGNEVTTSVRLKAELEYGDILLVSLKVNASSASILSTNVGVMKTNGLTVVEENNVAVEHLEAVKPAGAELQHQTALAETDLS